MENSQISCGSLDLRELFYILKNNTLIVIKKKYVHIYKLNISDQFYDIIWTIR